MQTPQSLEKMTWQTSTNLCSRKPQRYQNRAPNQPQIDKKQSLDPKLLSCAARCPCIVPWSPKLPKWMHQACQMIGFVHPKWLCDLFAMTYRRQAAEGKALKTHMAASILFPFESLSTDAPRKDFRFVWYFIVFQCISWYFHGLFMACAFY